MNVQMVKKSRKWLFLLYRKDRSWRSGKLKTARREAGMTNRRLPV